MSSAIEGLEPRLVWKYFGEISRIPRCSKHEGKIIRYIQDTARGLGLESRTDASGSVVVKKPASAGKDHVPMLALQGHLDMVCEKNKDTVHDFSKDPITIVREGPFLKAQGNHPWCRQWHRGRHQPCHYGGPVTGTRTSGVSFHR